MSQQDELLSSLFDGEASEFELRRALKTLDDDGKARWQRYQLMRDAMHNQLVPGALNIDVSSAVSAAIADEATPVAEAANTAKAKPAVTKKAAWYKPAIGFAAAASIAFVAVIGVQQPASNITVGGAGFVAEGNVSASQLNIQTESGLSTVSGVAGLPIQQPVEQAKIDAEKAKKAEAEKTLLELPKQ